MLLLSVAAGCVLAIMLCVWPACCWLRRRLLRPPRGAGGVGSRSARQCAAGPESKRTGSRSSAGPRTNRPTATHEGNRKAAAPADSARRLTATTAKGKAEDRTRQTKRVGSRCLAALARSSKASGHVYPDCCADHPGDEPVALDQLGPLDTGAYLQPTTRRLWWESCPEWSAMRLLTRIASQPALFTVILLQLQAGSGSLLAFSRQARSATASGVC